MTELFTFLDMFRVKKDGVFNYVGITSPKGRFLVPDNERDRFYDLYHTHVFENKLVCDLIERHEHIGYFLYDFDFKTDGPVSKHVYSESFITEILHIFSRILTKYLNIPPKAFKAFVMEKSLSQENPQKKDGLHIVFPYIVSYPQLQYLIRDELILMSEGLLGELKVTNPPKDIIDECVIEKNGWMMYGSNKPNGTPYLLTGIYDLSKKGVIEKVISSTYYVETKELVRLLSIRGFTMADLTPIYDAVKGIIEGWEKERTKKQIEEVKKTAGPRTNLNFYEHDISLVKRLVNILKPERATDYTTWMEVGWCLHTIDCRLLDTWIEFSKKSNSHAEEADHICKVKWEGMRNKGLNIGSLHMWAKQDNPTMYRSLIEDSISFHIYKSVLHKLEPKGNDAPSDMVYHVVQALKKKYGHFFVCSSYSKRTWFEFDGIRWVEDDDDVGLRRRIREELYNDYMNVGIKFHELYERLGSMKEEHPNVERYKKLSMATYNVATQLRSANFRKKVSEEASEQLYWDKERKSQFSSSSGSNSSKKFEEILNTQTHLIGMENGVYDLSTGEFRKSRCEDYLTLNTQLHWETFEWTDPIIDEIRAFLCQILPHEDTREYVMYTLASCLDGEIREEHFRIWVGSGGNGKSKLIELFELSFGEYCSKLSISALTQKRTSSSAPTPEIARLQGKRFAVLQEPNENEKLQVGIMKEMTGGDKIVARSLNKEPIEFKPQFKMVLTCNQLPKVPADDGGTWRRIRVVKFTSRFTENPDPDNPNEFPLDPMLGEKLHKWRHAFFWMLTEYYKRYRKNGLVDPESVKLSTREYQMNNDIYADFVSNHIESVPKGVIHIDNLFNTFQIWYRKAYPDRKCPSRKEVVTYMEKKYGAYQNAQTKRRGWRGLKLHDVQEEEDDDDDSEDEDML